LFSGTIPLMAENDFVLNETVSFANSAPTKAEGMAK
jgi:hypothetical protein